MTTKFDCVLLSPADKAIIEAGEITLHPMSPPDHFEFYNRIKNGEVKVFTHPAVPFQELFEGTEETIRLLMEWLDRDGDWFEIMRKVNAIQDEDRQRMN